MPRRPFPPLVLRCLLVLAGLGYIAPAVWEVHAQWLLDHPTAANLERGVRWHPRVPALWTNYAIRWLFEDTGRARDGYLQAARLNPIDPANWDGLATAYLQAGEVEKAEAALRACVAATPGSPQAAWKLANLLLLQQRPREALPHLRTAAAAERSMRPAVFDVALKILPRPETALQEVVPATPDGLSDYLYFLIGRGKLTDAWGVWELLRQSRDPVVRPAAQAFLSALIAARLSTEAARLWDEILEDSGLSAAKPAGELITNGDFEFDAPNEGLGWHFMPGDGYQIALDQFMVRQGSRSLRVTFDGTANPDFSAVRQLVSVEPNRDYRLRAYIRTENIGTDKGLQVCVASGDAPPAEAFLRCAANHVGDDPWTAEQIDFRTGANTKFVTVMLRRAQSSKFNNLLRGKVWIDDVSLQARAGSSSH